jgi:hypothetical protein
LFQKEKDKIDEIFNLCTTIINIFLERMSNYIDEKNQLYNYDYIRLLGNSYDWIYIVLVKLNDKKEKEEMRVICSKLFEVHNKYILSLIKLYPSSNKLSEELYGIKNSIVVFSVDNQKASSINIMKSKLLQFVSILIQYLSFKSDINNERFINKKE